MREAIKMILLQDAKGLGKTGDEFEVSTAAQAEYFKSRGIAQKPEGEGHRPLSTSTEKEVDNPETGDEKKSKPGKPKPSATQTNKET